MTIKARHDVRASLLHHVTSLLTNNSYVTLISLDFSKAFDTVRHSTLAAKLSMLDLPDNIYNWLVAFLKDRKHTTRFEGLLSTVAAINASVVQGSGVGPSAFVVNASDLHPVHPENIMVKYADDTYLIVGAAMRHTICEEMERVTSWAAQNNLRLNRTKSQEMIIERVRRAELPPPLTDVTRVSSMKILGVVIRENLCVSCAALLPC